MKLIQKVRVLHGIMIVFIAAIAFGIWTGLGFGIAWLLDAGINVDINKGVFHTVGMIIGGIHGGILLLAGLVQNLFLKSFK